MKLYKQLSYQQEHTFISGSIDEFADFGEVDDLVELRGNLVLVQPQDRPIQVHILAPGHVRMEARPQRNKRPHPPPNRNLPPIRRKNPGDQSQQRRLATTIPPNQAQAFPAPQVKRDIPEGPEFRRAEAVGIRLQTADCRL